jgi:hypothetical protein
MSSKIDIQEKGPAEFCLVNISHSGTSIHYGLGGHNECQHNRICMISGFCHKVDEICTLLGYYAAQSGYTLPTYCEK